MSKYKMTLTFADQTSEDLGLTEDKKLILEPPLKPLSPASRREVIQLFTNIATWLEFNGGIKIEVTEKTP